LDGQLDGQTHLNGCAPSHRLRSRMDSEMETTSHVRPPVRPRSRARHLAGLATERQAVKTYWSRGERFADENCSAARIILSDTARHGGEGAALVQWARLALRHEAERQAAA
jgi:hypothetical protein